MKRREFMMATGMGTALLAGGCETGPGLAPLPPSKLQLIDVHSHVFNASDLPAVRFIKIVFLKHYPKQALRVLDIDDPDMVDQLLTLLTAIVGSTKAPSASEETRILDLETPLVLSNGSTVENEKAVIAAIASFTMDRGMAVSAENGTPINTRRMRSAIFKAAGETALSTSDEALTQGQALVVAQRAYRSLDLGLVLRWFGLFTRYRHALAEQLASDHARQGFTASILCPALVDYDHWLGEYVSVSPLPAQVTVMGRIARRKTGPVVHGYVGFDPLRQVAYEAGIFQGYEPLALVRKAIREEGFVGVKLYPPMGYRPMGNADKCQTYPEEQNNTMRRLLAGAAQDPSTAGCTPRPADGSAAIGRKLDNAMSRLFDSCVLEHAVVMAHTNDSNGANKNYSHRADPAYWLDVFRNWPALHVGLAHFGSFDAESVAKPPGATGAKASWEWTLGRFLSANPAAPVYSDISYLVEIVGNVAADQKDYDKNLAAWVSEFDPQCRHLMFGTDWMMLGLDPAYEGYTERVYQYFRRNIGFDEAMLNRLFSGNAAAFLGLGKDDAVRQRLLKFYRKHSVPEARLPAFDRT
ncbi:MAG: amidohydrolase 2 protein [Ramlibacter sp.]|nr:amidohydrolase 2 protein [Ramlibacter sp.]